jgi:hypothetical protein
MLVDVGESEYSALLIDLFLKSPQISEPGVEWVAEQLGDSDRVAAVRDAAASGNVEALTALVRAGLIREGDELQAVCRGFAARILGSDLGMMPGGEGIAGLLALGRDAAIAAASGDGDLCRELAERLLVYASETRWPMHNRVNAIAGIWELRDYLDRPAWVERLRALAAPDADLDEESEKWLRDMWAQRGDLEAMAIQASAAFSKDGSPPGWLIATINDAKLDDRAAVVEAGWSATRVHPSLFEPQAARRALMDASAGVRVAVIEAWRASNNEVPKSELTRLSQDPSPRVKFTLLALLKEHPDEDAAKILVSDPNAYVRRIAANELR